MVPIQPISYPPKSAFGFFAPVPFWGANSRFRKTVRRQLLSRDSFKSEIDAMWSSGRFSAKEIRDSLECIRGNTGWPNALFLPSDSFLALAPLELNRYDAFTADCDTVNELYHILAPGEGEKNGLRASLKRSLDVASDIPLIDTLLITREHTIADVLEMIASAHEEKKREEKNSLCKKNLL